MKKKPTLPLPAMRDHGRKRKIQVEQKVLIPTTPPRTRDIGVG